MNGNTIDSHGRVAHDDDHESTLSLREMKVSQYPTIQMAARAFCGGRGVQEVRSNPCEAHQGPWRSGAILRELAARNH